MPSYEYPRPALTVDVAAFRGTAGRREVLLVRRGAPPFAGHWALPGGFVDKDEPLRDAALRELEEETGLGPARALREVGAYGDPGRDPRGWTVSVLFAVVLAAGERGTAVAGDDASEAAWHPLDALPPLAFDHDLLVADALSAVSFER
jgi:8-oxo-dGTP diphosphatase